MFLFFSLKGGRLFIVDNFVFLKKLSLQLYIVKREEVRRVSNGVYVTVIKKRRRIATEQPSHYALLRQWHNRFY